MNITRYINSGILEEFSMGLLSEEDAAAVISLSRRHPKVLHELRTLEQTLEKFAALHSIAPSGRLKQKVFAAWGFDKAQQPLDLENLPVTNNTSNHLQWLEALKHLIPQHPAEDFIATPLTGKPGISQTLVITKCHVPEETHANLIESFFILKGECICRVGKQLHHLYSGSFLEIPLHTTHTINIVSPYVVGILQHRMLEV